MRYRITIVSQWTTQTPTFTKWVAEHWKTSFLDDKRVRIHGQQKGVVISCEK